MNVPIIKTVGPPPTRHAERMAAEMTQWLIREQLNQLPEWSACIKGRHKNRHNDGNPKAQRKFVERLRAVSGPVAFQLILDSGKNGKFKLYIHRWMGWDNGNLIQEEDQIPERPWLMVVLQKIESLGNYRIETTEVPNLVICHHALARLAERCGAREPVDLLQAVNAMSLKLIKDIAHKTIDLNGSMPYNGWAVPFGSGTAKLIIHETEKIPLVSTVLP